MGRRAARRAASSRSWSWRGRSSTLRDGGSLARGDPAPAGRTRDPALPCCRRRGRRSWPSGWSRPASGRAGRLLEDSGPGARGRASPVRRRTRTVRGHRPRAAAGDSGGACAPAAAAGARSDGAPPRRAGRHRPRAAQGAGAPAPGLSAHPRPADPGRRHGRAVAGPRRGGRRSESARHPRATCSTSSSPNATNWTRRTSSAAPGRFCSWSSTARSR